MLLTTETENITELIDQRKKKLKDALQGIKIDTNPNHQTFSSVISKTVSHQMHQI